MVNEKLKLNYFVFLVSLKAITASVTLRLLRFRDWKIFVKRCFMHTSEKAKRKYIKIIHERHAANKREMLTKSKIANNIFLRALSIISDGIDTIPVDDYTMKSILWCLYFGKIIEATRLLGIHSRCLRSSKYYKIYRKKYKYFSAIIIQKYSVISVIIHV